MNQPVDVVAALLAKAEEKLTVANGDLKNGFFDDAASRAYYAAYHAVAAVLARSGRSFASHGQTLGAFNLEFVKTGAFPPECYRKLQRLFEDRQIGDYSIVRRIDRQMAERDVADAEWLVEVCRAHLELDQSP